MNASFSVPGYQVLSQISAGERTEVWEAIDEETGDKVALKILPNRYLNALQKFDEFYAQMNYLGEIAISEMAQLRGYGEYSDGIYLVSEFVNGNTVQNWIEAEGRLSAPQVIDLAEAVATALKHAWDVGAVMHGDLSPSSIMIDSEGNIKVLDLGTAEIVLQMTHRLKEGINIGVAYYVSPRQAAGASRIDYHADIYALGSILYQAITGHVPFGNLEPDDARRAHISEHLADPRSLNSDVPAELVFLVEKMLAKETKDRFRNWDRVLAALEGIKKGEDPPGLPIAAGLSTLERAEHLDGNMQPADVTQDLSQPKKMALEHIHGAEDDAAAPQIKRSAGRATAVRSRPAGTSTDRDDVSEAVKRERQKTRQKDNTPIILMSVVGGLVVLIGVIALIVNANKDNSVGQGDPQLAGGPPGPGPTVPGPAVPVSTNSLTNQSAATTGPSTTAQPPAVTPPRPTGKPRPGPNDRIPPPPPPPKPQPKPQPGPRTQTSNGLDMLAMAGPDKPEILWQAGKFNGWPLPGGLKSSEYNRVTAQGDVIDIAGSANFVQMIQPGQSFKVSLPGVTEADATIRLAVNAPLKSGTDYSAQAADVETRGLRLSMNGTVILQRWIPAGHSVVEAYASGTMLNGDGNTLVIQNVGKEDIAFDAVWIERFAPGARLRLALDDASWLPTAFTESLEYQLVPLPPVPEIPISVDPDQLNDRLKSEAPVSASEAVAIWSDLSGKIRASDLVGSVKEADAAWGRALATSLKGGMLPVVRLSAKGNDVSWKVWAQRYGAYVGHWVLYGSEKEVKSVAKWLSSRIENPSISLHSTAEDVMTKPSQPTSVSAIMLKRNWAAHGGRTDMVPGTLRKELWANKLYTTPVMHHWLNIKGRDDGRADINLQRMDSDQLAATVVQWWMAGGNNTVIQGAGRGESFFPDGTAVPAVSWDAMRLLIDAASGEGRRLPSNLNPVEEDTALGDTQWVAVQNSSEQVSVIIRTGSDAGVTTKLTVPVPWQGETGMIVQGLEFRGAEKAVGVMDPTTMKVTPEKSYENSSYGVVKQRLTLNSLKLVTLVPVGKSPTLTPPTAPVAASSIKYSSDFFEIGTEPMPLSTAYRPAARSAQQNVDRLSELCTHAVGAASKGSLPAWASLGQSATVSLDGVIPWSTSSEVVSLPGPGGDRRPHALRLLLDVERMEGAAKLLIWVRPIKKDGSPGMRYSTDSFVLGTPLVRQKVRLSSSEWTRLELNTENLKNADGKLFSHLTLWMDPHSAGPVQFELNGFVPVVLKKPDENALSKFIYMHDDAENSRMLLAFVGEPGAKGPFSLRLSGNYDIGQITHYTAIGTGHNLDGPQGRRKVVSGTNIGQSKRLRYQTAVGTFTWNPYTRMFTGNLSPIPPFEKSLREDSFVHVIPEVDWKVRHGVHSKSLLSFRYTKRIEKAP